LSIFIVSFALACGGSSTPVANSNSAIPEVKKEAKPVADAEIAVIEMENPEAYGTIKIELYSNIAPKNVARFKELAKEGFYNGIAFHRINQSVIQAGDPRFKADYVPKPPNPDKRDDNSDKPNVEAEFSDIPYDTGIVGAARLGDDFNSANSQFFITLKREAGFDNKYTIFGKVIEGMNNARTIAGAPKNGEEPVDDIRIKEIRIEKR
jgi:cyclophilin family peptidyl-prolyl cis-trans isomerase